MNLEETSFWASELLPEGIRLTTGQVNQGFPEFTVADVFLGGTPDSGSGPAETVALTLDAAHIEPGLITDDGSDLRVEFVSVTTGHSHIAADLVIAAATMIAQDPRLRSPQPGLLLADLGSHVDKTMTAKNGLLIPPFLWEDGVPRVHEIDMGGQSAAESQDWTHPGRMTVVAQLVMLTDAEFAIATNSGLEAVQQALVDAGTNLNDVWR